MTNGYILELAAILILPMIPAFVLYKSLPSRTKVSGPFKGLDISLTGAFGGYFLLVLLALGHVVYKQEAEKTIASTFPRYETWELLGTLEFSGPPESTDRVDSSLVTLTFHPDPATPGDLQPNNTMDFSARIPVIRKSDGSFEFPFRSVFFEHDDFHMGTFYVKEDDERKKLGRAVNEGDKKITVKDSISLRAIVPDSKISRVSITTEK